MLLTGLLSYATQDHHLKDSTSTVIMLSYIEKQLQKLQTCPQANLMEATLQTRAALSS